MLRNTSWQCVRVDEAFRDRFYCYLLRTQAPLVKMAMSENFPAVDMVPKNLNMFALLLRDFYMT